MHLNSKIFLAGSEGMVGTALYNELIKRDYKNILSPKKSDIDLTEQSSVIEFFRKNQPGYVLLIAGKVGGIQANIKSPADFIYDNVMISANVIHAAHTFGVKQLLLLGSSCIYPKFSKQPMREEYLLTGSLEPTNEYYAIAKIAGIKLCEAFSKQFAVNYISLIPPNLYGPNDNFDLDNSHVIAALIRKFHFAKEKNESKIELWGTGKARREFLYVDDLVDGILYVMNNYNESHPINIGSGKDYTISDLAEKIKTVVGFQGEINWNSDMPDGMQQKLMDSSKIRKQGWHATISLESGLNKTYKWFLNHVSPSIK